jgi:hypothetical protein
LVKPLRIPNVCVHFPKEKDPKSLFLKKIKVAIISVGIHAYKIYSDS